LTATLLIHHAANRGHSCPPSSLRGLQACLEAGARVVEVDVIPLTGGDFALLHDERLENVTNGTGNVSAKLARQVCHLRHTWQGVVTDEPVGLLSQAVSLVRDYPHVQELQLDLKPDAPPTEPYACSLFIDSLIHFPGAGDQRRRLDHTLVHCSLIH